MGNMKNDVNEIERLEREIQRELRDNPEGALLKALREELKVLLKRLSTEKGNNDKQGV